jgi:hypothetical protein
MLRKNQIYTDAGVLIQAALDSLADASKKPSSMPMNQASALSSTTVTQACQKLGYENREKK